MNFTEKVDKLPESIKKIFLSNTPRLDLEKSCFMYGIKNDAIQNISSPVGLIFVKDIKLENLPQIILENLHIEKNIAYGIAFEINARIFARFPEYFTDALDLLEQWQKLKTPPIISEDEAWKKVLELEPWILENEKEERETKKEVRDEQIKVQSAIEKIAIRSALEKFPELGEQLITSSHIKLKNFPEPVRPSINNWLSDYTFNLGFESHSAMERGTYLFRNENAKALNSTDREKISFVLKAYDENSLVDVNANTKQIVFPKREQIVFNGGSTSKREVEPPRAPYQTPQRNIQEVYNSQKQEVKPRDIFKEERIATQNRNTGNINFSSPQRMPYEKQTIQPIQPQKPTPAPQPMHISSQNLRNNSDKPRTNSNVPLGNIVNLKE